MLWEEVNKYTELTGEDGNHTPIMKIGAYLDGYEKGLSVLDKIRAEIELRNSAAYMGEYNVGLRDALKVIDKYTKEL